MHIIEYHLLARTILCFPTFESVNYCCHVTGSYSETMSVQTFHYIQTQLENCYDMLSSDKKKMLLWSRRMHLALRAYKVKIQVFVVGEGEHNVNRIFRQYNSNLFPVYSTYTSNFSYHVFLAMSV